MSLLWICEYRNTQFIVYVMCVVNGLSLSLPQLVDTTISFKQQVYNVGEIDGLAQPTLVLSNPSSTDITIQVRVKRNNATS